MFGPAAPVLGEPVSPRTGDGHAAEVKRPWWQVMCLTGLDLFSSLGYQPGIAALAAGLVAPIATIGLVALQLFGALPVYRRVAGESPRGEGSVAMLERLLGLWKGKLFVLGLLGFAATAWVVTMTLSAADGAGHLVANPYWPRALAHQEIITLVMLALLGAVFLKGFGEAIGIAVVLVAVYLCLNVVVTVDGLIHILNHPHVVTDWRTALFHQHSNVFAMLGVSVIAFPQLTLGMSGFETGVAVMPQIVGDPTDTEARPRGRIRGARRLLTTAAVLMSALLVLSSICTTLLIPQKAFQPGGAANGRALAYLAHQDLGSAFGTIYDLSTITILWFAGASAMAGMLNLIPRYLPRYGMSPVWAAARRPLVLVITAVAFAITLYFRASVDAQSGAYAAGLLVLMTSASIAVTLSARRAGQRLRMLAFGVVSAVFIYTTINNMISRPDGLLIGCMFIIAIVVVSLVSRIGRSFELRAVSVELDEAAERYIRDTARRQIRLIATEPDRRTAGPGGAHGGPKRPGAGKAGKHTPERYADKLRQIVARHDLTNEGDVIFVEVLVTDPSEFESTLRVTGSIERGEHRVLRLESAAVPNALAALLLHIRDLSGVTPHIYVEWTEGSPVHNLLRFLFLGVGEVAPTTREVLRRAEPDPARRPHVHAG